MNAAIDACPFCSLPPERIVESNEHFWLVMDAFPVSPGHSLVISRRHVGSFFDLDPAERDAAMALLSKARQRVLDRHAPDGFNIGINDGPAAGQTVPHLHIHLIPRYAGDLEDPRGGVRWVIPDRADYWSARKA
jgi:diadenosine tetraphosphate (Ap4A) HIT family hydrolase